MTEEQAEKMIEVLRAIDWKLWEIYKQVVPQEEQINE
jgi:hypothetical protein